MQVTIAGIVQRDGKVVGAVPRLDAFGLISERRLGLIMPEEHGGQDILERTLLDEVLPGLDVAGILRIASAAAPLDAEAVTPAGLPDGTGLKIGYFKDAAFSFYYAENLEALRR